MLLETVLPECFHKTFKSQNHQVCRMVLHHSSPPLVSPVNNLVPEARENVVLTVSLVVLSLPPMISAGEIQFQSGGGDSLTPRQAHDNKATTTRT